MDGLQGKIWIINIGYVDHIIYHNFLVDNKDRSEISGTIAVVDHTYMDYS